MKTTMKNIIGFLALILLANFQQDANAQVGINTTTPIASAMLDVTSTTEGMLIPFMSFK